MGFPKGHKPTNGFDKRPQDINRDGRPLAVRAQLRKIVEEVMLEMQDVEVSMGGKKKKLQMERMKALTIAAFNRAMGRSSADARTLMMYTLGVPIRAEIKGKIEVGGTMTIEQMHARARALKNARLKGDQKK